MRSALVDKCHPVQRASAEGQMFFLPSLLTDDLTSHFLGAHCDVFGDNHPSTSDIDSIIALSVRSLEHADHATGALCPSWSGTCWLPPRHQGLSQALNHPLRKAPGPNSWTPKIRQRATLLHLKSRNPFSPRQKCCRTCRHSTISRTCRASAA